jgi:uncharacterized protein (DUF1330 family)
MERGNARILPFRHAASHRPRKLEQHRDVVLATVERYGGHYLTVGGRTDVVEGDWRPVFPVLIEFPDLDQARRWYDSEEYRAPKALRRAAARGNAVFIEGKAFGPQPGRD